MRRFGTLFTGQEFYDLPKVGSTNAFALDLLSKSKPSEGTVISTCNQTAGRGQIGSNWESEPGKNISLSIIYYPVFLPAHTQFLFNQAISLAVHDLVAREFAEKATIKWPNDIYISDKKVAGILIQNTIAGHHLRSSVAGIGINVNQEIFVSRPPNPTSYLLETGAPFELDGLITLLLRLAEARYLQLKSGQSSRLQRDYCQALYRFGEEADFLRSDGHSFKGRITGVTDIGKLRIDTAQGEETFGFKTIQYAHLSGG